MFEYLKAINRNELDHQEIMSVKAFKILGRFNLLFDRETYQSKTLFEKILNLLITVCPFIHWYSLFIYLIFNIRSIPIETFAEEFALSIGGILVAYRLFKFNRQRSEVSDMVAELNLLNQKFRKERKDFSHLSNRIHYWQMIIGSCMTCMGGAIGLPQAGFALASQNLYYDHIFPVDTSEMSLAFYLVWAFQFFTVCSCTIASTLQECILTDWFIQLSLNYYFLNRKAKELRKVTKEGIHEEVEFAKLIEIIQISQQLDRLATRLNNFINAYLSLIFSLFFVAVSTSIFVLISVAGQGIVFIIKSFFYPIFATAVMVLWCIIGQILVDQTTALSYSLYQCNWIDAPLRFRRILYMFMVRNNLSVEIDAKPFYTVNLFMFTDFLKRTYCLMALLLDMQRRN